MGTCPLKGTHKGTVEGSPPEFLQAYSDGWGYLEFERRAGYSNAFGCF